MGTEINVTVGPPTLRQQNRQQIDANRWRRAEQDAQQRTEADARAARQRQLARQGLTAGGQARYGDPLQSRFQRQKPAAFRFGGRRRFCSAPWFIPDNSDQTSPWRVLTGDWASSFSVASLFRPGLPPIVQSEDAFILPAGNGVGIVIFSVRIDDGMGGNETEIVMRAVAVSLNRARLITVPTRLREVWAVRPFFLGEDFQNSGYAEAFSGYEYTPRIFEVLNGIDQFVSPSLIKQFPSGKNYITRDERQGFFAGSETDKSLYYAEWLGDPTDVDFDRDDLLISLPLDTLRRPASSPDIYYFIEQGINDRFYWDWDDPDYCRQMCLALGFSAADLTP